MVFSVVIIIHHVNLADTGAQCFEARFNFRNHTAGNRAVLNEAGDVGDGKRRDEGRGVRRIAQQARHVGDVCEFARRQRLGERRRGRVRIDVVDMAVRTAPERTDYGDVPGAENFAHRTGIHRHGRADVSPVERFARLGVNPRLLDGEENPVARQQRRFHEFSGEQRGDKRADLIFDDVFDNLHRSFIRHAEALHEAGLQPRLLQGARDGFAAAVHHDGQHPHDAHERNVHHRGGQHLGILLNGAAQFDDNHLVLEIGDVRERFNQHVRFVDVIAQFHDRKT